MSQSVLSTDADQVESAGGRFDKGEFSYRPVPAAAPVTVFLGLAALLGFITYVGLGIGLFGTILGAVCVYRIQKAGGELGGKKLAIVGFGLSLTLFVSGTAWHIFNYVTEVPEGFRRISFLHDISKKGLIVENGVGSLHPDVAAFDGEDLFVKGFVYPERQTEGLTEFLLCKDSDKCCFGGQPKVTDMIMVTMKDGLVINFRDGLVSVGGAFRAQASKAPEGVSTNPIYAIKATYFSAAKTEF